MPSFFNADKAFKKIRDLSKAIKFESDKVAAKTLSAVRKEIKAATPVGYTGETRRGWVVVRRGLGSYRTFNKTNAAWFLEHGTRAHGPVTKRALFIPLNRRGFFVYRAGTFPPLVRGEDYITRGYVKGIQARQIAGKRVPFAVAMGQGELVKMLRKL